MKFYYLEPEVGGSPAGDNTIADWIAHPPKIDRLHWEMDCWLGDVLLWSFPCWIATVATMNAIKSSGLTGTVFDDVEVTMTENQRDFDPDLVLPDFVWLKVVGKAGHDDFGVARDLRLVVSERALKLLQGLGISHAKVEPYNG